MVEIMSRNLLNVAANHLVSSAVNADNEIGDMVFVFCKNQIIWCGPHGFVDFNDKIVKIDFDDSLFWFFMDLYTTYCIVDVWKMRANEDNIIDLDLQNQLKKTLQRRLYL